MDFSSDFKDKTDQIINLFAATFAASEGADEGERIGALARNLIETTPDRDLFVFTAWMDGQLVGCICFSRLRFEQDDCTIFLLSPVAVETKQQGKGTGKALLNYGLSALRDHGVSVAVTYGDPNYYGRVGFQPITEEVFQAPLPLHQPEGWLAQSLTGRPLKRIQGPSHCVEALNNPAYW